MQGNNPVKYTDPDGNCLSVFIGCTIAVGIFMLPKRHDDGYLYFDNLQRRDYPSLKETESN